MDNDDICKQMRNPGSTPLSHLIVSQKFADSVSEDVYETAFHTGTVAVSEEIISRAVVNAFKHSKDELPLLPQVQLKKCLSVQERLK